jgi:hypothetical protein
MYKIPTSIEEKAERENVEKRGSAATNPANLLFIYMRSEKLLIHILSHPHYYKFYLLKIIDYGRNTPLFQFSTETCSSDHFLKQ